jgi:hypothetical protein
MDAHQSPEGFRIAVARSFDQFLFIGWTALHEFSSTAPYTYRHIPVPNNPEPKHRRRCRWWQNEKENLMLKRLRVLLVTAAMVFALGGTSLAGGWALTVVNDAPEEFTAGTEHQITYTILQHGRSGAKVEDTSLDFFHPRFKGMLSFPGEPTGKPGEYVAAVTLPTTGSWSWEVNQGWFGVQSLGSIDVFDATTSIGATGWGDIVRYALLLGTVLAAVVFATQVRLWRREALISPQSVV